MEGSAEPVVAVIGHPIAGNPTQFALETAFDHAGVDARVLSFDVPDERFADAMRGLAALGFRGVWMDPTRRHVGGEWLGQPFDALVRNEDGDDASDWLARQPRQGVLAQLVVAALGKDTPVRGVLMLGRDEADQREWADWLATDAHPLAPVPEAVIRRETKWIPAMDLRDVNLVLLTGVTTSGPTSSGFTSSGFTEADVRAILQSRDDHAAGKLVVADLRTDAANLAGPAWTSEASAENGLLWIDRVEIHAHALAEVMEHWFDCRVPVEILRDAIEEYLAI